MSGPALLAHFFLQVTCILLACRGVGWLAARAGQPAVVAEMVTGFLLGPSFLGWIADPAYRALFPAATLPAISLVSQIGLVLYMFTVGLEFRTDLMVYSGKRAVVLSIAGIVGPFLLSGLLVYLLRTTAGLFTDQIGYVQAAMFIGTALSITAFPVLARIIGERGISGTTIGSLALGAGAIDDAAAWIMLAVVLGSLTGDVAPAIVAAGGGVAYAIGVLIGVPRLLNRFSVGDVSSGELSAAVLTSVLGMLMLGAWFTEAIGIHAVFGAFLFGVSFRRGALALQLRRAIEPLASSLFVPLFFVYAGLHTQLQLLNTGHLWAIALLVFAMACCGKGVACWLGAYWTGASKREALALATLMNTRGMVELILIDIGLTHGIITPTLYTMLVLMAIGTTLITGPLFGLIWQRSDDYAVESEILIVPGLR